MRADTRARYVEPLLIALATIAFNKHWLIEEQARLLQKYLQDDYTHLVIDNSTDSQAADDIKLLTGGYHYARAYDSVQSHHQALNAAGRALLAGDYEYIGFLDHDVFPTRPTTLIDKIEAAGFYGVGQRHAPTGHLYLWPGFCFFSREWLNGRTLDFTGIRGEHPRDNGDTGSGLWPLFQDEDWSNLFQVDHGYKPIREPDGYGLQSFGVETFGDWLHLTNGSGWMTVPDPEGRERILREMVAAL